MNYQEIRIDLIDTIRSADNYISPEELEYMSNRELWNLLQEIRVGELTHY